MLGQAIFIHEGTIRLQNVFVTERWCSVSADLFLVVCAIVVEVAMQCDKVFPTRNELNQTKSIECRFILKAMVRDGLGCCGEINKVTLQ